MVAGWRSKQTGGLSAAVLGDSTAGDKPGVPYSALYDDVYHAAAGAWAQARHVFLAGNGLPERWRGRTRFVILEAGFGLGNNFLATWAAWLDDPARCDHLIFISIEKHPLTQDDLARVHQSPPHDHRRALLGHRLAQAWPVLTPGWHQLRFAEPPGQAVSLWLGLGDVSDLLPHLMAAVDAIYLDGFSPAKNPDMWQPEQLARLQRLTAPGATAATWSCARVVRDGLAQAGFTVERQPGFAGKRDMIRARHTPHHVPKPPAGGLWPPPPAERRRAVVIGAGLAGCAAARALCHEGWQVTVIDRQEAAAAETSGNPGGLFHSVLHGEDGPHARGHRAAALSAWRVIQQALAQGVKGSASGLIRLDPRRSAADASTLLSHLSLPADHVRWCDQHELSQLSGVPVPSAGWLFHQAGWVDPSGLARWLLDDALKTGLKGAALTFLGKRMAHRLQRSPEGLWQVLDAQGALVAQAPHVVLACAHEVNRLIATLPSEFSCGTLPLARVRGQVSWQPAHADTRLPQIPVAGGGYALSLDERTLLFGATTQHHDEDPDVRPADHQHNLAQARTLGMFGLDTGDLTSTLSGRVGWRATTPDRLPLVGALPWSPARVSANQRHTRLDQPRLWPRERDDQGGLYVLSGLGSRGITWSVLAADLLCHWMSGLPCPVDAPLRDALDPARFLAREQRLTD